MKEQLLIDYLEDAEDKLRNKTEKLQRMNREYRESFDRDLRQEIDSLRKELRKARSEIVEMIYVNMDEFRCLHKYFPDLLEVFFEDDYLGKTLSKKRWLLSFQNMKPAELQAKLMQIRGRRTMLRHAKKELRKRGRTEVTKQFFSTFPSLKGKVKAGMSREEALSVISGIDDSLRKDGWAIMVNSHLIESAIARFWQKVEIARAEEAAVLRNVEMARGRGTVAEHNAKNKLRAAQRRMRKAEKKLAHLMMANPEFLKNLKKNTGWTKKGAKNPLEEFARTIKMKRVKEKPWLEHMNKKLS